MTHRHTAENLSTEEVVNAAKMATDEAVMVMMSTPHFCSENNQYAASEIITDDCDDCGLK